MDDTQSHSTPVHSYQQKRTMTSTIKKWQPSSMVSNVADHISLAPTTQLWSEQTIRIYNTAVNHKKSQVDNPNGWSSSMTSITISIISLSISIPYRTSSPHLQTLPIPAIPQHPP